MWLSLISMFLLAGINVYAEEDIYYTNDNGVSLTKTEYDFFTKMYWDGYQEFVTPAKYNKYASENLFTAPVTRVEQDDNNGSYTRAGTIHETSAKILTLSKACGSMSCSIIIGLQWKATPRVLSHDVMGALLYNGLNLTTDPITTLYYNSTNWFESNEIKYSNKGFGVSVKLRSSSSMLRLTQEYDVKGTGILYASYQHAMSTISLPSSKCYTVNFGGYGGVFDFYGNAYGVYDQMAGVETSFN